MKKLIGTMVAVVMLASIAQVASAQMVGKIENSVRDAIEAASSVSEAVKIAHAEWAERKAEQFEDGSKGDLPTYSFNGVDVPADAAKGKHRGPKGNFTRREDTWKSFRVMLVSSKDSAAPWHCIAGLISEDDSVPDRGVYVHPKQPGKNALCNTLIQASDEERIVDVDVFGNYIWENGTMDAMLKDVIIHEAE